MHRTNGDLDQKLKKALQKLHLEPMLGSEQNPTTILELKRRRFGTDRM
jgi:hypothetical protein